MTPHFKNETKQWEAGNNTVVGLDEVGRGAIAGPVVVGAVAFDPTISTKQHEWLNDIRDSKACTQKQRERLTLVIKKYALWWSIGTIPADTIDTIGINKSLTIAAENAIRTIPKPHVLISDPQLFTNPAQYNCTEIENGDSTCISIAAASIVAKTWRDAYMTILAKHWKLKKYQWQSNKGYGSKQHQKSIQLYGPCFYHRHTFLSKIRTIEEKDTIEI